MSKQLSALWLEQDSPENYLNRQNLNFVLPSFSSMERQFLVGDTTAGNRRKLILASDLFIKIVTDGIHRGFANKAELTLDVEDLLGASLQAGKDYYVYLVQEDNAASIVISMDSTFPTGSSAADSRKIGGFHTLCADVGTIADHPLSGYLAGDILPASVWCLSHKPKTCGAEGMFYNAATDWWVDIYLQSGTGATTASVYGGTVTKSRTQSDHLEDMLTVGKTLISDNVFTAAAEGSNQKTAIAGAADPVTTGGHVDTAGRRMISNEGGEDMCGAYTQWCCEGFFGSNQSAAWAANGTKGSIYQVNGLVAGGHWGDAAYCGSRMRSASNSRLAVSAYHGGRGAAPNIW